ncbi:MAG: flavodoxin family protein [Candidatus Bipolaricaulia bacterium]
MVGHRKAARVLGVFGSPRRGGNSATLLEEALVAAEREGAVVERVFLADRTIGACRACEACLEGGICVQEDDMQEIVARLVEADIWIIGTPVYWWGPSAQLKAFLDRWYAPWHHEAARASFKTKRAALIVAMGDSDAATGRHVVGMFQDALAYIGVALAATVLGTGLGDPDDAARRPDLLAAARAAGRKVTSGL